MCFQFVNGHKGWNKIKGLHKLVFGKAPLIANWLGYIYIIYMAVYTTTRVCLYHPATRVWL